MDQHTPKSSEHHSESEDALEVPDMAVEVGGETLLLSASECRAEVLYASLLSGLSVLELLALTAGPVESAKMADGVIHVRFLDGAPIDAGAQLHEVIRSSHRPRSPENTSVRPSDSMRTIDAPRM